VDDSEVPQIKSLEMKPSDDVGFALFLGFGLWWVIFPKIVIRFYAWFHRGRIKPPSVLGVRLAGAMWILLMMIVMVFSLRKH
jgi:succinate-acetate transporter protein